MNKKRQARLRRMRKTRAKIKELGCPRLTVFRSTQHIYAQVIDNAGQVIASASSIEKVIKLDLKELKGKTAIATKIGNIVAERAIEKGINKVAFDRSGFKYHGRIKALADGARESGIEI